MLQTDAEKIVIGSMLIDPTLIEYVIDKVRVDDFYYPSTKLVYSAILELFNTKPASAIGPIQIYHQLKTINQANDETLEFLWCIMEMVPSTLNIDQYIDAVLNTSYNRKSFDILKAAEKVLEDTNSDKVNEFVIQSFEELAKHKPSTSQFKLVGDIAESVITNTEEAHKKGEKILGLSTGFEDLDTITNGLQKNNLIILAARPAVGKSSLALNIATAVANKQKNVAYFSLEMSSEQLVQRLLSTYSTLSLSDIQNGSIQDNEWAYLLSAVNKIKTLPIHIDQSMAYSVSEIKAKCLELKAQGQLDLIVIDYLQLITAERGGNRVDEVGYISRELKKLAQTLEVPVLALSQLSRGVEQRQDKRPMLSDLRESGSIEQDADIVMFLYRNNTASQFVSTGLPVALDVAKNRQGRLGTVELIFNGRNSKFVELGKN